MGIDAAHWGADLGEADGLACMNEGFEALARRAWRRALTAEERSTLSTMRAELSQAFSEAEADALVLQFILQSPHFLYYPEFGVPGEVAEAGVRTLTAFELAARMAAFLWDSIPDADLLVITDGASTWEQLAATARQLRLRDLDSVVLVSDPYHSLRLTQIADEVGLEASVSSTDGASSIRQLVRETAAVSLGRILGYRRVDNWLEGVG